MITPTDVMLITGKKIEFKNVASNERICVNVNSYERKKKY